MCCAHQRRGTDDNLERPPRPRQRPRAWPQPVCLLRIGVSADLASTLRRHRHHHAGGHGARRCGLRPITAAWWRLGGLFQRASIVTGFGWLTVLPPHERSSALPPPAPAATARNPPGVLTTRHDHASSGDTPVLGPGRAPGTARAWRAAPRRGAAGGALLRRGELGRHPPVPAAGILGSIRPWRSALKPPALSPGPAVRWPARARRPGDDPLTAAARPGRMGRVVRRRCHGRGAGPGCGAIRRRRGLCVPALTADQTLCDALGTGPGATLLVNGAGGVTGTLIVQLAACLGAEVMATAGAHSAARVSAAGAAHVLDRQSPDWPGQAASSPEAAAPISP